MTMTTAHQRMHMSYCPDLGACVGVGGEGRSKKCRDFEEKLRQAEEEHTQAAARKLLDMHYETVLAHGAAVGQGLALAYKTVAPDPYKEPQS